MIKSISIFILFFFTLHLFSQNNDIVKDTIDGDLEFWAVKNYYTSEVDLLENRNDTLRANVLSINYYYQDYNRQIDDYLIVFYEVDNLLMIEQVKTGKKQFYFLNFRIEVGVDNFITNWYRTEDNKGYFDIQLRYIKSGDDIKKLAAIEISDSSSNPISYTYYIE